MLTIELHDSEPGNTLAARIGSDGTVAYDYQAEQWVQDTAREKQSQDPRPNRWIVRWVLFDGDGERAVWERASGDPGLPKLVRASPRFRGEWKVGT